MTTTFAEQRRQLRRSGVQVMVRGFRGKAFAVLAVAVDGNTVLVSGSEKSLGIGYNRKDVFIFEPSIFDAITQATNESIRHDLWESAKSFSPDSLPQLPRTGQ